ncbi:energy transducer TonB [Pedobacter punctiformis]|uniref:Energy transducer TonB n=1 Tax=Pedobacter punctiformis TaxID=3004097 RepID=A0ABT4L8E6_9SPHI|nr:energy transducer TonB [Pedobacter sp. HCMS5-2]MCZ4244198.1 energy transducer TonB [Pedobacter sp. HCMS5-2]
MFNSSFNVYKTEWLDLVFSNRNKSYGAYELRSNSSKIMTKSLIVAGSLFMLLFFSPMVYNKLFPKMVEPAYVARVVDLSNVIHDNIKKEEPKKEELKKAEPEQQKVKTVKMVSNIVVTSDPVVTDPPTMKELEGAVVSNVTHDGDIKPNLVITDTKEKGDGNGTGKIEGTADNGITDISGVDEYPEFAGGMNAWAKYIQRNLRYPSQAQEDGIQGKVFISFVVEKDGSITDVKVVKGIGYGCDEEAAKVIKKSPLWKPGKNAGVPVRVRYNLPINFTISN